MLRGVRTTGGTPKRFLIISLADTPYQAKIEGMLAKALQLRGYQPLVLTGRGSRWVQRYLRAFGINDFLYIDDFTEAETDSARAVAAEMLAQPLTVQRMKDLQYRGAGVGRHVLSIATRQLRQGSVQPSDPRLQQKVAELLPQSIQAVQAAEKLLDRVKPDLIMFHETRYATYGAICDVALTRGLNVIQYQEAPHGSHALQLKRYTQETRRFHPHSLSDDTWALLRQMPWTPEHEAALWEEFRVRYRGEGFLNRRYQETPALRGGDRVRELLGLDPARKTAVIFPHVLWDANLFFGEDLFADQEEWLVETVKAACANPRLNWVVKVHPANAWKGKRRNLSAGPRDNAAIHEAIGELPPHVRLLQPDVDINTFDLFNVADYGLTIRGTIGLELPCFGVPVFTGGTGRYSGRGFTIDSVDRDDLLAKLAHIEDIPRLSDAETLLAKKYAFGLFRLRPWRMQSMSMVYSPILHGGHPLEIDIDLNFRSPRELTSAPDLLAFADWAVDPTQLDFLQERPSTDGELAISSAEKAQLRSIDLPQERIPR